MTQKPLLEGHLCLLSAEIICWTLLFKKKKSISRKGRETLIPRSQAWKSAPWLAGVDDGAVFELQW